ncbi:type VI secretion system protein TssA [Derxia gummosa]|uniref:Type VI secretion system protein TssA n=1 Tax=Derxia gummosa DSM 723 TaxID=1121388 RepID=A0A8B6X9F7_9BURK|nr:type VI secretion system protein TssA [Derxia gummosa]
MTELLLSPHADDIDAAIAADTDAFMGLGALLAPLPDGDGCGPSLRYDAVMARIRTAREEEDPSLPMGDWERPLKVADWQLVRLLSAEVLARRSKDAQVAAWWLEASLHLRQGEGLVDGIALVCGLVERFWDGMHPAIDDGDLDLRRAPFAWLADLLPLALRLHLTLLPLPGRKPPRLSLDDWERQSQGIAEEIDLPEDRVLPPRETLLQLAARPDNAAWLAALRGQLERASALWARLGMRLDERMGLDSPNLQRTADTLMALRRAVDALAPRPVAAPVSAATDAARLAALGVGAPLDGAGGWPVSATLAAMGIGAPVAPAGFGADAAGAADPTDPAPQFAAAPASGGAPPDPAALAALPAAAELAGWQPGSPGWPSRAAAYRTLEAIADYLQDIEPHSPTPYLIRRAVNWGRMPLPQLMQEMLREEGDIGRLFRLLGVEQE